jgi:hypothetical protein
MRCKQLLQVRYKEDGDERIPTKKLVRWSLLHGHSWTPVKELLDRPGSGKSRGFGASIWRFGMQVAVLLRYAP